MDEINVSSTETDVGTAAAVLKGVLKNTPEKAYTTVSTPAGKADVILDGDQVDVRFHDGMTLHVRK
jgi:hypothetical protein